jgi:hypothetical protein
VYAKCVLPSHIAHFDAKLAGIAAWDSEAFG